MNEPIFIPSDDAIERGLASRAPHRLDGALIDAVMTGVHATRQVPRRGVMFRDPVGDRRRPVVLSVLAAVLIVGGTLAVSTGSFSPVPPPPPSAPAATLPAAVVPPSTTPQPSPSAKPVTCATQTTSVLTGAAMPPTNVEPVTVADSALKVGVYMTAPSEPSPVQTDVWTVTAGTATRIAAIVGPDYNQAFVDDVSRDGRIATIGIGVVHGSSPGPSCSDLYAIRTDGSGATRLTFNGPDAYAQDSVFSQDGRYVAFRAGIDVAASPVIGLVDLQGDATEHDVLCDASVDELHLAWSPFEDRLAAVCGSHLMVADIGGSPARVTGAVDMYEMPTGGQAFVGVGWRDPGRILVVTADNGQTSNVPINLATLTVDRSGARDGNLTPRVVSVPRLADPRLSTRTPVSPDGKRVALDGDPVANDTRGDTLALYVLDATSGVAQRVAPWGASDPGWSSDSRSLVYMDFVDERSVLTVYDLAAKTSTALGSRPNEYGGGIWRLR